MVKQNLIENKLIKEAMMLSAVCPCTGPLPSKTNFLTITTLLHSYVSCDDVTNIKMRKLCCGELCGLQLSVDCDIFNHGFNIDIS